MGVTLQDAIDNNIGIYRVILDAQGLGFRVDPEIGYTTDRAPPYYSNAVTRSADWRPDARFESIHQAAQGGGWRDWSIKDSHDVLDLASRGFRRLFRATWICLDPADVVRPDARLRFEVARAPEALARWRQGWDARPEPARTLFGSRLLNDETLHFVTADDGRSPIGGCLFNETGHVLGISNFFAPVGSRDCWAGAIDHILGRVGPKPVVGYARDEVLADFLAMGFQALGPLSVWHLGDDEESASRSHLPSQPVGQKRTTDLERGDGRRSE